MTKDKFETDINKFDHESSFRFDSKTKNTQIITSAPPSPIVASGKDQSIHTNPNSQKK